MKKERLVVLDILRVLATLMVFFVHIWQHFGNPLGQFFGIQNFYWVSVGGVAVSIFLILSGFVLTYNYKVENYYKFVKFRLLRIYPTYWLSIFVVSVFIGFNVFHRSLTSLIGNFSGFLVFSGHSWTNYILGTGWFVGLIVSLYLIFPLLKWLFGIFKSRELEFLIILLMIEVFSRLVVGYAGYGYRTIDWFPLARVFEFGLGIYLASKPKIIQALAKIKLANFKKSLIYLSNISFPFFLIHYTMISAPFMQSSNINIFTLKLLFVTMVLSHFVYSLDRYFQGIVTVGGTNV